MLSRNTNPFEKLPLPVSLGYASCKYRVFPQQNNQDADQSHLGIHTPQMKVAYRDLMVYIYVQSG